MSHYDSLLRMVAPWKHTRKRSGSSRSAWMACINAAGSCARLHYAAALSRAIDCFPARPPTGHTQRERETLLSFVLVHRRYLPFVVFFCFLLLLFIRQGFGDESLDSC